MDRSGRGGHLAAAPSDAGGRWALLHLSVVVVVVVRTRLNNYLSLPYQERWVRGLPNRPRRRVCRSLAVRGRTEQK